MNETTGKKPGKIFISHSSQDLAFVQSLVELFEHIGLTRENMFCSSVRGYDVPLDKNIYDYLKEQFRNYDLRVIFVLSENYYKSPASLSEMGAAWVLQHKYTSVLLPQFDFKDVRGAIDQMKISIKLDSEETELQTRLNELRATLVSELELKQASCSSQNIWERHRNAFINKINSNSMGVGGKQSNNSMEYVGNSNTGEDGNRIFKDSFETKGSFETGQVKPTVSVQVLQQAVELKINAISVGMADSVKMNRKIENARHVKLFQTTGRSFMHAHIDPLSRMLGKNGTLQILLPNPYSEFLRDVDRVERRGKGNPVSGEFHATIDNIRMIWEQASRNYPDTMGTIQIGCARTMLRQTEIICIDKEDEDDKDDKQIWCWVTMTLPPSRASGKSMSLESQTAEKGDNSLVDWVNANFNRSWEESDVIIEFDGTQEIPYFYMEKHHAKEFWEKRLDEAKKRTRQAQEDDGWNGILIEVAAQYPLEKNEKPGEAFFRRLDMGHDFYRKMEEQGHRCRFYVSLGGAGTEYLVEKGIPLEHIYGERENIRYRGKEGVHTQEDECFVASQIREAERFAELYCVCSPVESMRKIAHYTAFKILPSVYCWPSPEMADAYAEEVAGRYAGEMIDALPDVLYKDPKPGFINIRDKSGNVKD